MSVIDCQVKQQYQINNSVCIPFATAVLYIMLNQSTSYLKHNVPDLERGHTNQIVIITLMMMMMMMIIYS